MKEELERFYNKNRPLFEITAIVLIFTGLILNLPSQGSGIIGESLKQLKFFLLLGSGISLLFLLIPFYGALVRPILYKMEKISRLPASTVSDRLTQNNLALFFAVAGFVFLFFMLFLFNLFLFIALSYRFESLYVILILSIYLIFYKLWPLFDTRKFNYKTKTFLIVIYWTSILALTLIIPVAIYAFFYLNLYFNS